MSKYRIMIVDDEAEMREGIVRRMDWAALGFEVAAEAENGQDALEKAEYTDIDVVLTDIKMPYMDGLTMSAELIKLHPMVKLIILTGFDEFDYAREAIKLNVVEYVLKPVNVEELSRILTRIREGLDADIENRRNIEVLRENYEKALPLMRERFFNELLWGVLSEMDVLKELTQYNIPLSPENFMTVAVFDIDPISRDHAAVALELAPLSLKQMVEEQLSDKWQSVVFLSSSSVITIIAWAAEQAPMEQLIRLANEVCSRARRVLNISVTAGVGRKALGIGGVHTSFQEARAALQYRAVSGTGGAIYIGDMEETRPEPIAFDVWGEELMLSTVKFGTGEQISLLIDDILARGQEGGDWERRAYMLGVLNATYRIIQRYGLQAEAAIVERMDRFVGFEPESLEKERMREWLTNILVCISEFISARRVSSTKKLVEEAKRFIHENYQDPALSVEKLCEHLHVSQSYFSTIFKQETGRSYVQYLTDVRMEHALRLLQETDDKTYIIAHKVGYEEPNYFSYAFKKRFGVSPTKFRK